MIEASDTNAAAFVLFIAPPIDNTVLSGMFLSIRATARVKIISIRADARVSSRPSVSSLIYIYQLIHWRLVRPTGCIPVEHPAVLNQDFPWDKRSIAPGLDSFGIL